MGSKHFHGSPLNMATNYYLGLNKCTLSCPLVLTQFGLVVSNSILCFRTRPYCPTLRMGNILHHLSPEMIQFPCNFQQWFQPCISPPSVTASKDWPIRGSCPARSTVPQWPLFRAEPLGRRELCLVHHGWSLVRRGPLEVLLGSPVRLLPGVIKVRKWEVVSL